MHFEGVDLDSRSPPTQSPSVPSAIGVKRSANEMSEPTPILGLYHEIGHEPAPKRIATANGAVRADPNGSSHRSRGGRVNRITHMSANRSDGLASHPNSNLSPPLEPPIQAMPSRSWRNPLAFINNILGLGGDNNQSASKDMDKKDDGAIEGIKREHIPTTETQQDSKGERKDEVVNPKVDSISGPIVTPPSILPSAAAAPSVPVPSVTPHEHGDDPSIRSHSPIAFVKPDEGLTHPMYDPPTLDDLGVSQDRLNDVNAILNFPSSKGPDPVPYADIGCKGYANQLLNMRISHESLSGLRLTSFGPTLEANYGCTYVRRRPGTVHPNPRPANSLPALRPGAVITMKFERIPPPIHGKSPCTYVNICRRLIALAAPIYIYVYIHKSLSRILPVYSHCFHPL